MARYAPDRTEGATAAFHDVQLFAIGEAAVQKRPGGSRPLADIGRTWESSLMDDDAYVLLGIAAWLGMLLAPPAIARAVWRAVTIRRRSWALHLLFPPAAIGASAGLAQIVFFAAHDDGEGPPGLGLALLPPMMVLMLTMVAYALCLAATALRFLRDRNIR